ncbi:MAG: DegV family protein [Clostridiales bacterium]|nr:DegV family protein [Clostridiales bacterium]
MIVIVTDSSACMTRAEADVLGIRVVPMTYYADGRTLYNESYMDENGQYEALIERSGDRLRTSQATMSAFLSAFDELISEGHEVLCLTISSRLSGTYGNALMAARALNSRGVAVVDSLTTGAGHYMLAREARRMLDVGLTLGQTAAKLKELRARVRTVFSVDDMMPLRRSGRLGSVRLSVSTILNIKPLLTCADGGVVSAGTARGRNEQLRALVSAVGDRPGALIVQHFMAEGAARALEGRLAAAGHSVVTRKIGPVLGIHLGRGLLGVAWIEDA